VLIKLKDRIKPRKENVAASAVILAFTVFLFAPTLSGRTFSMVGAHMFGQYPWIARVKDDPSIVGRGYPQTDQAETFYPASVFATNALREGQFPMWLPYSFNGIPIMEVGIGTGLQYPPKLAVMPFLSPSRQHDLVLFTHLLMAGLGMYGLLRCWGANAAGAVLGALVWELNGHNSFWLVLEHVAIAAAWLPLMLLGATLAVRRQSFLWAVAGGGALGMSILNGFLHYVYLSALVLACWYAFIALKSAIRYRRQGNSGSALLCLSLPVVSAVVAMALGAASWAGLVDLLSHVHRQPLTLDAQLAQAIPFAEFAQALIRPRGASGLAGKEADVAGFAFVGIPGLVLAIAGVFRRRLPTLLAGLVGVISVGIAVGFEPLISFLRFALPYFGTLKPHVGFFLFSLAVAVLASFGFTEFSERFTGSSRASRLWFAIGCLLISIEAWELLSLAQTLNPVQRASPEWMFPETPLITRLRELQGDHHILPVRLRLESGQWTPPVLTGKIPAAFGLRWSSGYESLLPLHTAAFWRTVEQGGRLAADVPPAFKPDFFHDRLPLDLLQKASVGLLATPPDVHPRDVDGGDPSVEGAIQLVYQGADGWIYKLNHALPRAFLVQHINAVPDAPAALGMLVDKTFDANKSAIVISEQTALETGLTAPASQEIFKGRAAIASDLLNEVVIESATNVAAMLVLNDSWDPGWRAYVDGREQPVLRVNYAFRGVVVPPGEHTVLFRYRPRALLIGLSLSAATLCALVILFVTTGVRFWKAAG
jgi:hypothetical protein